MRFCFGSLLALLLTVASPAALSAQADYDAVVTSYVARHDANVSARNWARVVRAPVDLAVTPAGDLVATVRNDARLRLTLQRDPTGEAADMDGLFPSRIESAILVLTNTTVVIIDPRARVHFVLSLLPEPLLPDLAAEPVLVYEGFGLTRDWSAD